MNRRIVVAVIARPWLWAAAVTVVLRLAPHGWWRRWPPLPLPDPDYWRFRMATAYGGDGGADPTTEDVVEYLAWCRRHQLTAWPGLVRPASIRPGSKWPGSKWPGSKWPGSKWPGSTSRGG